MIPKHQGWTVECRDGAEARVTSLRPARALGVCTWRTDGDDDDDGVCIAGSVKTFGGERRD